MKANEKFAILQMIAIENAKAAVLSDLLCAIGLDVYIQRAIEDHVQQMHTGENK